MKKICLIGATNTGKSTLTKRLSQYFECKSITDFSEYHFKNQ
jgi:adenylate kinase family enzyme